MTFNPDLYHGQNKTVNFFEEWYFKVVDAAAKYAFAFIPGISIDAQGEKTCFLKIINLIDHTFFHIRVLPLAFYSNKNRIQVQIKNNIFSSEKIFLDFTQDNIKLHGVLYLSQPIKWPSSKLNPGTFGLLNYFPFLNNYSQACALNGKIEDGHLILNNTVHNFKDGNYYIEKHWGKSYPKHFFSVQSNNFYDQRASLTCFLTKLKMPLLNEINAFFIGITIDEHFYSFTSLNRSFFYFQKNEPHFEIIAKHSHYQITIQTLLNQTQCLLFEQTHHPTFHESPSTKVMLKLLDTKTNLLLYEGIGRLTTLRFNGDVLALTSH